MLENRLYINVYSSRSPYHLPEEWRSNERHNFSQKFSQFIIKNKLQWLPDLKEFLFANYKAYIVYDFTTGEEYLEFNDELLEMKFMFEIADL